MKFFKSPQKVLIVIMFVLLVISSIFIVRLELKAASLQSRLDEHHKSLEKNKDILENLDSFTRKIKSNGISIDGNKVVINAGKSSITLQNNNIDISSEGKIAIGTPTKSIINIEKDGDVFIGPNNQKSLGYDKNEDYIYMWYNGSRIILGQHVFTSGKEQGIRLVSKDGGPRLSVVGNGIALNVPDKQGDYKISMAPLKDYIKISKGESVIKLENENIDIEAKGDIEVGPSDEKNFGYRKSEDYIYMLNKDSRIVVGPLNDNAGKYLGNGIMLIGKTDGPQLAVRDEKITLAIPNKNYKLFLDPTKELVGLRQDQSSILLKKNNLEIDVQGDINITSKNGNVNINGKKVNLNE